MPFSDAISVNAPTHLSLDVPSQLPDHKNERRQGGARRSQSVNISQTTVERFAREKLREALMAKLGYNRIGALGTEETVGQNISAKV